MIAKKFDMQGGRRCNIFIYSLYGRMGVNYNPNSQNYNFRKKIVQCSL